MIPSATSTTNLVTLHPSISDLTMSAGHVLPFDIQKIGADIIAWGDAVGVYINGAIYGEIQAEAKLGGFIYVNFKTGPGDIESFEFLPLFLTASHFLCNSSTISKSLVYSDHTVQLIFDHWHGFSYSNQGWQLVEDPVYKGIKWTLNQYRIA